MYLGPGWAWDDICMRNHLPDPSHLRSSRNRSVETCVFVLHGNTVIFTINHVSWQEARGFFWFQILHLSKPYDKIAPCWEPCSTMWGICHSIILDLYVSSRQHERPLIRLTTVPCLEEAEFMFPLNWQQHTVSTGHFTVPWSVILNDLVPLNHLQPQPLEGPNFPFQPYAVDVRYPAPHGMYKTTRT